MDAKDDTRGRYLQPWVIEHDTGCECTNESGWDRFYLEQIPTDLDDLGFLTKDGCTKVRDACGDDYSGKELFMDVCSRGWAWLPWTVLDVVEPWSVAIARKVHHEFMRKFETM